MKPILVSSDIFNRSMLAYSSGITNTHISTNPFIWFINDNNLYRNGNCINSTSYKKSFHHPSLEEELEEVTNEHNPLRQGWWKLWDYTNEISEAAAPELNALFGSKAGHKIVYPWSYWAVVTYAWMDTIHTAKRSYQMSEEANRSQAECRFNALDQAIDTLIFQHMVSVLGTAPVIGGIRRGIENALERIKGPHHPHEHKPSSLLERAILAIENPVAKVVEKMVYPLGKFKVTLLPWLKPFLIHPVNRFILPTALSLAAMPLVIKPLDEACQWIMGHSYRPIAKFARHQLFGSEPEEK